MTKMVLSDSRDEVLSTRVGIKDSILSGCITGMLGGLQYASCDPGILQMEVFNTIISTGVISGLGYLNESSRKEYIINIPIANIANRAVYYSLIGLVTLADKL
jgi:hypothetical protein